MTRKNQSTQACGPNNPDANFLGLNPAIPYDAYDLVLIANAAGEGLIDRREAQQAVSSSRVSSRQASPRRA